MIDGNRKLIYLACPYSHDDPKTMQFRFIWANRAAYYLMRQGYVVFSPLSHSVPIEKEVAAQGQKNTWSFWKMQDFPMIRVCDEFWIFMLDGWEESEGIQDELESVALPRRMPVKYLSFTEVNDWWKGQYGRKNK